MKGSANGSWDVGISLISVLQDDSKARMEKKSIIRLVMAIVLKWVYLLTNICKHKDLFFCFLILFFRFF